MKALELRNLMLVSATLIMGMVLGVATLYFSAGSAGAAASDAVCEGLNETIGGGEKCKTATGGPRPDSLVKTAVNILTFVVGIIAVITMIVYGLHYITSGGDPASVGSARKAIIYVVVGLIIVAMAQALVHFVIGRFEGID